MRDLATFLEGHLTMCIQNLKIYTPSHPTTLLLGIRSQKIILQQPSTVDVLYCIVFV